MSNFYEDRCGRVAFERVLEVNDEMNFLDKSGHLLSCGGVYVSRSTDLLPCQNHYDFLVLPSRKKTVLTLKNHEIQENAENVSSMNGEEILDQVSSGGVKKMMREHMN